MWFQRTASSRLFVKSGSLGPCRQTSMRRGIEGLVYCGVGIRGAFANITTESPTLFRDPNDIRDLRSHVGYAGSRSGRNALLALLRASRKACPQRVPFSAEPDWQSRSHLLQPLVGWHVLCCDIR